MKRAAREEKLAPPQRNEHERQPDKTGLGEIIGLLHGSAHLAALRDEASATVAVPALGDTALDIVVVDPEADQSMLPFMALADQLPVQISASRMLNR